MDDMLFGSGITGQSSDTSFRKYPDPFLTFSSSLMPRTTSEMLRWCESIFLKNGTYAAAMRRVVSYFITKLEVHDASDDKKKKYETYFNDVLNVKETLINGGLDWTCYGNGFVSLIVPFKRFLRCSNKIKRNDKMDTCNYEVPIDMAEDWKLTKGKMSWTCPQCKKHCDCERPVDRRFADETKLKLKLWNPHEMQIMYNPISERKIFIWDPPADLISRVKQGDRFIIADMPWEMVETILEGKLFEFAQDVIYHMPARAVSGIRTNGWGISSIINNFHQAYYIQMAKMYNEVLMQEYIIPFRVITPQGSGSGGQGDPLIRANVGNFNSKVLSMINTHRQKPGGYYGLPFPIDYQAIGGEGAEFTTYEHINMAMDELLNASNVPAELYKGSITFQALPTALRLFQQTWVPLLTQYDLFLDWLAQTLAVVLHWDKVKVRLQPVTLADDLEKRQVYLQLLAGNKLSAQTALAPLGVNAQEEFRRILDEQREQTELQSEFAEDMQQKQTLQQQMSGAQQQQQMGGQGQGQPQQGGAGGDPSQMQQQSMGPADTAIAAMSGNITPDDMMAQARQVSGQLLKLPYEVRRGELAKLKKSNETLWSLVKSQMQQMRQQAQSAGGQQMLQSQ